LLLHTTASRSRLEQVVLSFWISKNQRGVSQVVGAFVGKELVGIELGVFVGSETLGILVGFELVGMKDGVPLGMPVGADDGIELVGIFVGVTLGKPVGSEIVGAPVGSEKVGTWLGSFVGITIFCTITPLPLPTTVEQPL